MQEVWLFEDVDDGDLIEDLDRRDDGVREGEIEDEIIIFSCWWRQAHDEGVGEGGGEGARIAATSTGETIARRQSCDLTFADDSAIEQNITIP